MKRLLSLLLGLLCMMPVCVFAAGTAKISAPSSVENGSNVSMSVTVSGVAAWNLTLSGSGATTGCTSKVADVTADASNTTKTFSVTCKATKIGTIYFQVIGDITSADGTNSPVSLTKNVTVVTPRERDKESRLESLKIDGYEIDFDKDKTSYAIEVEYDVNSVKVDADSLSSKAKVEIDNPEYLIFGENTILIKVTSESGDIKNYTIKVTKNKPVLECEECPVPEPVKCEKPTNTGYIVTISIEAVALISLLGYLIYDKKIKK